MSSCCSSSKCESSQPTKYRCPVNFKEYHEVSKRTIVHHLKEPWSWTGAGPEQHNITIFVMTRIVMSHTSVMMIQLSINHKYGPI